MDTEKRISVLKLFLIGSAVAFAIYYSPPKLNNFFVSLWIFATTSWIH